MTLNHAQARVAAEAAVATLPGGITIDPAPPAEWGPWLGYAQSSGGLVVPDTPPVFVNTETGTVLADRLPPGFAYDTTRPAWDRLVPPPGLTAAAETFQDDDEPTGVVLVALPAADDPVNDIGEEEKHATLLWFGEAGENPDLDLATLTTAAEAAATVGQPFTEQVDGVASLGDDGARVWMIPAGGALAAVRNALLDAPGVQDAVNAVEQHDGYTPHVTIGYPAEGAEELDPEVEDAAAAVEQIGFDRLALWVGDDHSATWTLAGEAGGDQEPAPAEEPAPASESAPAAGAPWFGILAPEEVRTGDGREFAEGSLTWRDLPLPLMFQDATALGHDGAVRVGRIDAIERDTDTYPTPMIRAVGTWDTSPTAEEAQRQIDAGILRGTSIDADDYVAEFVDANGDPVRIEDLFFGPEDGGEVIERATAARICGATLCSIPAFHQAYVANGTRDPSLPEPGQTEQAPEGVAVEFVSEKPWGNFTAADYTNDQWKNATLIHLDPAEGQDPASKSLHRLPVYEPAGALNRGGCHAAASVLAGGRGGVDAPPDKREAAATTLIGLYTNQLDETPPDSLYRAAGKEPPASAAHLVASARPVQGSAEGLPPADWFRRPPALDAGLTALTIDGDRLFGHLAAWGTCHIGHDGVCITPPHSATGYAYYATGVAETDEGLVQVGQVTMDTGHAAASLGWRPAAAHYDNTGAAVADIAVGEDEWGIWFAGCLRDTADQATRAALAAAGALSGDWRDTGGPDLELVACLAVNVPGFPVPRLQVAAAAGRQTALVASGILEPEVRDEPPASFADQVIAIIRADRARRSRVASLRRSLGRDPATRIAAARRAIGRE